MKISKRVYGAVFAGVLACGMATGSVALAEGGLLQTIANGGASTVDVVEDVVDEGTDDFVASDVLSFKTVVQGPVTYQANANWTFTDESDDEASWYYFEDDYGMFECVVYPESMIGFEDDFSDEYVAYLADQVPNGTFYDPNDLYLDGVLIRHISFQASEDDLRFRGVLSIVYGEDYVAVCDSVFLYDLENDQTDQYVQTHRSIGLSGATGDPMATVTVKVPASQPEIVNQPAAGSDLPMDGTMAPGDTFQCEGWIITVNPDPSTYQWVVAPDDFYDEAYQGAQMVAVPIEITNATGATDDPFLLSVYTFNSNGLQQANWPGIGFDDSIESIGSIRNGATATCYLYVGYTGDGEYAFEFVGYDEEYDQHVVEVPIQIVM